MGRQIGLVFETRGLNLLDSDSGGHPKGTSHVSQFVHITPHDPDVRKPSCFMIMMYTHAEDTTPGFYLSTGVKKPLPCFTYHSPGRSEPGRSEETIFSLLLNLSFPLPSHGTKRYCNCLFEFPVFVYRGSFSLPLLSHNSWL